MKNRRAASQIVEATVPVHLGGRFGGSRRFEAAGDEWHTGMGSWKKDIGQVLKSIG